MVDAIDIILHLEHDASELRDNPRPVRDVEEALGRLQRHGPVLPAARVDLEGVLVGEDLELDAAPRAAEAGDRDADLPVVGRGAFGDEACVWFRLLVYGFGGQGEGRITIAYEIGVGRVGTNLLWRAPEVVVGVGSVG